MPRTRYTYDAAGRLTGATTTNAWLSAQDQHSSLTYGPGNTIASLGVASNIASVTLDVACASPLALTNWLVEANGVPACSSIWRETQTDFIISNVPLGGQQLFVRVRLDGRAPAVNDAAGWSHWGTHQPATNTQLHFAVEPAAAGDADRVPVNAYATPTYTYDAAGQLLWRQSQVSSFQDQVSYRYDAARNMVQCHGNGFTNRYEYDYLRRLNRQVHEGADGITSNSYLRKQGYRPMGNNPLVGKGNYVNKRGRYIHIDAEHPPGKPPHVGVYRPRKMRQLPPREYPL